MYQISLPILGVFGTSSNQGKFTVQLSLREQLIKYGYRVAQLGSEPSALLFGMNECFLYGYQSTVDIKGNDSVRYLNSVMHMMETTNPDIIIVGGQSGLIPYDLINEQQINFPQYEFLLGTFPDAFILCVNPFDDIEYIKRTIAFLESVTAGKVIALVLYPMTSDFDWDLSYMIRKKLDSYELQCIKNKLEQSGLPFTFILGEKGDMDILTKTVIDYFSE